jgi:hypothetical protein
MNSDEEAELTLWSNGVAEVLDGKGRPELAALFRALARRDEALIEEDISLFTLPVLEGLRETLQEERDERDRSGQEYFAAVLDGVLALVEQVRSRRDFEELDWDEEEPVH